MTKIISVVGARPNFMKIAPFVRAIAQHNHANPHNRVEHILVHTGQHYDDRMSQSFFEALGIPPADINLGIGSGTHAQQVGRTMIAFEEVLHQHRPDWVVVVGDVNATLACSVTAKKEHVRLCHVEAGLRSGDIDMPEEVNRLVTDRLADLLLTPDRLSSANLRAEGVAEERIVFVGNIMIDTLEANRHQAQAISLPDIIARNLVEGQSPKRIDNPRFATLTLHRPSNVDYPEVLEALVRFFVDELAREMPLVWAVHPRTRKQLAQFGLWNELVEHPMMVLLHPLNYHDMLRVNQLTHIMLTDSGGLQEECTVLGTPCLTLRWNTERPVTLRQHGGVSVLVGNHIERIRHEFFDTLQAERKPERPELWDGHTATRVLGALLTAGPVQISRPVV